MAEEKEKMAWGRTAAVMAQQFNMNRTPSTAAKSPRDFNPYFRPSKKISKASDAEQSDMLKKVFCSK